MKKYGNAITVILATETIIEVDGRGNINNVADKGVCRLARAPQSFRIKDLLEAHQRAEKENISDMIDCAILMNRYGMVLHTVDGSMENIKITTPADFCIFRAILEARESPQILGL